jgi:hypothetical protein
MAPGMLASLLVASAPGGSFLDPGTSEDCAGKHSREGGCVCPLE